MIALVAKILPKLIVRAGISATDINTFRGRETTGLFCKYSCSKTSFGKIFGREIKCRELLLFADVIVF